MIEKSRRFSRSGVAAFALLAVTLLSGCKPKPADIRLKQTKVVIYGLKRVEVLQAEVVDRKGQVVPGAQVAWTSSNPKAATVEASGVLKAVGSGKTKVTATCEPLSAIVNVEVFDVASINVSPDRTTLAGPAGSKTTFIAEAKDSKGAVVAVKPKWASGNPKVATVGPDGVATSVSQGRTTINASLSESIIGVSDLTVIFREVASFDVTPTTVILRVGESQRLNTTSRDAAGAAIEDVAVDWASGDPRVATCTGGTINALSKGSTTIRALCAGKSIDITVLVN